MKNYYLDTGVGRMIEIDGRDYFYFSGTSYLGMAQDMDFLDVLANNLFEFGANHGQSRNNNIRLRVFDEFEESFAFAVNAEEAAVFSSGYLAGIAASKSLAHEAEEIWIAPDSHSAIVPDNFKPAMQLDFLQWKNECLAKAEQLSPRKILIIGNALDPIRCEIHDYGWVSEIAKKHQVAQLIDDSHAFGTLGPSIYGTFAQYADPRIDLMVSGSLGKGLGLPAGIILGSSAQIQKIKQTPLFGGASPGSPAHLQTFLELEDRYLEKKAWLKQACELFANETANISQIKGSKLFPAFAYSEDSWVREFEKAGIITSSFAYPTSQSPSVNRIVISGFHEKEDLMYLSGIIQNLAK
ncbi:aminotransferase class I/II-fold pyridoxal phosphate-dependent enzyme [Algoriphagus litoralis]|uniref:aminotransferase class I/II-fold pyridoxal phosphate-dependent enzyme n=1 Tax=Algoriphagus litoralis TaxID=2202829 RepID=UPI000DB904FC|nr:aminotransferase class I/II-fold pyridoxal phosphate-dependent enzyme [Algoriphagus litoralis]